MTTAKTSLEIAIEPVPSHDASGGNDDDSSRPFPTDEEWQTLPRVAGSIPWTAWTVAFVEFVERFSYYGTSAVCKFSLFPSSPRTSPPRRRLTGPLPLPKSSISSRKAYRLALPLEQGTSRSRGREPSAWASAHPQA